MFFARFIFGIFFSFEQFLASAKISPPRPKILATSLCVGPNAPTLLEVEGVHEAWGGRGEVR